MTKANNTSKKGPATPEKSATMWVGNIAGIFGYGFAVIGHTREECDKAMRAEYRKWKLDRAKFMRSQKQAYDPSESSYDASFVEMGGVLKEIKIGKVYFDNFAQ